jgi:hypothetical protein
MGERSKILQLAKKCLDGTITETEREEFEACITVNRIE